MAVLTWNEILQRDKQAQMTGAQGLTPEQLGALRSAELTEGAVNARNIFNQNEINRRNAVAEKQASDMLSAQRGAQNFEAIVKLGTMAKGYYPQVRSAVTGAYDYVTGAEKAVESIPGMVNMAEGWSGEGMDSMAGNTAVGSSETSAGSGSAAGIAALAQYSIQRADQAGRERGGTEGLVQGTPFSLPNAPATLAAGKVFGDDSYVTKNIDAINRQEQKFYESATQITSGDFKEGGQSLVEAIFKPITAIFGRDK